MWVFGGKTEFFERRSRIFDRKPSSEEDLLLDSVCKKNINEHQPAAEIATDMHLLLLQENLPFTEEEEEEEEE